MTRSTKAMKAVRAHERGGPDRLVIEQVDVPEPGPGEVLVAVHAAAITFAELGWDLSWTTRDGVDRTPVIPSHEMSGVVVSLGADVTGLEAGEEVYGLVDFDRDGAAAEFVVLPPDALAQKPRSLSHVEAAALPLSALTALQALVEHVAVAPGDTVLVHGGAGGVGVYAVQIATVLGAHVIATDMSGHAGFLRELGAERVIDATTEDFAETVSGVDVVIDTVGGPTLEKSYSVLRPGGRLVTLGGPPSAPAPAPAAAANGVKAVFFVVVPDRNGLRRITSMVDDGALRSVVSQTFALDDARTAFESGAKPRPPGKTVLVVR